MLSGMIIVVTSDCAKSIRPVQTGSWQLADHTDLGMLDPRLAYVLEAVQNAQWDIFFYLP